MENNQESVRNGIAFIIGSALFGIAITFGIGIIAIAFGGG